MRHLRYVLKSVAVGLAALILAPAASAQATRTWVSGVGDDVNPCSRTAPCKTFAGAISKTAAGGLINVLDPGGFGAVTITKSITIEGYQAQAGVLASGGQNGIIVNGANVKVILRNLSIEGAPGTGLNGINFIQGAQLTVDHCRIFGFQGGTANGIRVVVNGSAKVMVKDTEMTDNGVGIHLETSTGQLLASIDNVRIEGMTTNGLETAGAGQVFVAAKHSAITHNNGDGVHAGSAASVINLVDNSLSFNNGTSVNAAVAGSRIRIATNMIVNNQFALGLVGGAFIESANDNVVAGFSSTASPNGVFNMQ